MKNSSLFFATLALFGLILKFPLVHAAETSVSVNNNVNSSSYSSSSNKTTTHVEVETDGKKTVYDQEGNGSVSVESKNGETTINGTKTPDPTQVEQNEKSEDNKDASVSATPKPEAKEDDTKSANQPVKNILASAIFFLRNLPQFFAHLFFSKA